MKQKIYALEVIKQADNTPVINLLRNPQNGLVLCASASLEEICDAIKESFNFNSDGEI